jgi:outer membrane protein OmpA-like peptidoglycan-associated protein
MNIRLQTQVPATLTSSFTPARTHLLQRKCTCGQHTVARGECAECRKKRLQRKAAGHTDPETVPPIVHEVLRSPGQPLDAETREFMEPRFGHDFSQVRVHTNAKAAESARAVNALAYTVGRNVVFGLGRYSPHTGVGRQLLAHELTHTLQQQYSAGIVQQNFELEPTNNNTYEQEAMWAADQVLMDNTPIINDFTPIQPSIQRVCGSRAIGSPSGCNPVGGVSVFDISSSSDELYLFERNCDDFQSGEEGRLRGLVTRFGPSDVAEIHGFASEEGPIDFNEHLSCARALEARSVLIGAGLSPTNIGTVFKHGATPGPRPEHRSVVIPLPTPTPSPPTPTPTTPTGPTCTPRTGITEWGCYCGAGTSCTTGHTCPPVDALDACCQAHDICYDACGCTFSDSINPLSSDHAAARACDTTFCNCLRGLTLTGAADTYRQRAITLFRCP